MSLLRRIALSLPIVMLLIYGSGGVGLVRCACTNHTSLLLPTGDCCPGADCMQLSIAKVSDASLASKVNSTHVPELTIFFFPTIFHFNLLCVPKSTLAHTNSLALSPPINGQLSMVMRV